MNYLPHSTKIALAAELAASTDIHYVIGFNPADDFATNVGRSIGTASFSASDLVISEDTTNDADGVGTKITFAGKTFPRTGTATNAQDVTVLFVDGSTMKFGIDITPIEVTAAAPNIVVSGQVSINRNPTAL